MAAAILAGFIGGGYFIAWMTGEMRYAGRHAITMKTNAALCLTLCGIALALAAKPHPHPARIWSARVLAALALVVGALTLSEHLLGLDLGIDQLLAREPEGALGILHPNRMGPPGALSFTLCGVGVLLTLSGAKWAIRLAQQLAIVLCLIALMGMLGYLYGVEGLYGAARFTAIAWPTTVAIFLLGIGLLFARPREGLMNAVTADDAGGLAIRRLLIPVLVLPPLIGYLRLQGEWHGLYQRYVGTSLMVLTWMVIFSILVYRTGRGLSAIAAAKHQASTDLQRTQALLLEAEKLSQTGAWEWDLAADLWTFSDEWLRIHGAKSRSLPPEELLAIAHPDDRSIIEEAFEKLRSGESPYRIEHRIVRQDTGQVRTVRAQGHFLKDAAGAVVRVYGFAQDITEQKLAEHDLEVQRQLLETIVTNLPVGVLTIRSSDLRVLGINPAFGHFAPGKELFNKTIEEIWPELQPDLGNLFRHVVSSGEPYHAVDEPFLIRRVVDQQLELRSFTWSLVPVQLPGEKGLLLAIEETSERMRAEEAVRRSENRLRNIVENMAEGLIVIDPDGGSLLWNRKALEMHDATGEEDELASMASLPLKYEARTLGGELVPEEEWPVARIMRGESLDQLTLVISDKARGWRRIFSFSGILVRETDGSPQMGVLNVTDVTDTKKAEEAVRQSEELLRTVLETLPVGVWVLGPEGRIEQVNRAGHDMWGGARYLSMEEFGQYHGWWPDSGKRVEEDEWPGVRALLKGETILNEEIDIEAFDGTRKVISHSAVPIRNERGETTGAIIITQDVTARKQAEEALRASEKKFRDMFQFAAVGMGRVSFADARWIDVNDAVCRMLGYSVEEMLAVPWPEMTHPDDLELDLVPFRKMAAGELDMYSVEKRYIHKDGHYVWARLTLSLVRTATGAPDYEVAVIEDITVRKQAEETLQKSREELELRVKERTRELEQAYQNLTRETEERIAAVEHLRRSEQLLIQQSRMAAMGEMLGNIAHQWRQPLNILGLLIQALPLSLQMGVLTTEVLEEEVGKIMRVILHMSQTINDFRDFLQEEKEKKDFSVNHAVATTISLFEASLKTLEVEVEVREDEELVVKGHRNEFSQVVMNIITNARDAFRERSVPSPRITISIFREDGKAVVTIADNAGGIPEEILERIFEPYFTTKGPDKGTGIGLFMSKNIIEKSMGGVLTARNVGEGAEFRIEL